MDSNGERTRLALPFVAFVWTVIQIPFASTAFRVDETNIIRIAERFAAVPLDPYGFFINWGGREESAFHILANPPGAPVWLAVWGEMLGWSETVLHLSMVPFGLIAIFALASLAQEFELNPVIAVLLMLGSPAFFVGAQVVMPDVAMFSCFVAALAGATRYKRTGEWWLIPVAFFAGALAPIMKYNGALVGPLLLVVWLYGRGRRWGLFAIMSGPAAGLAAWSLWSWLQYGQVHFLTIAEFESGGVTNIVSEVLGFFGLGVVPLAIVLMRAPPPLSNGVLNATTGASGVMIALAGHQIVGMGPWASIGYGLSAAITFRVALVVVSGGRSWLLERDFVGAILLAWIAIGTWFQFGLLFSSVRYLLPLLPPVIFFVMRCRLVRFDRLFSRVAIALSCVLSVSVAIGDARTANLYRRFAEEIAIPEARAGEGRFFFDGHWGFQYYMERGGGKVLNFWRQPRWQEHDLLVIARNPFPSHQYPTQSRDLTFELTEYEWSPEWPVRTIDCSARANFYGPGVMKCKGPGLPFGFSMEKADVFAVYKAVRRNHLEEARE